MVSRRFSILFPSPTVLEAAELPSPDTSASPLALCTSCGAQTARLMACGHVACQGHETCNCEGKELAVSLDFRNCEEKGGTTAILAGLGRNCSCGQFVFCWTLWCMHGVRCSFSFGPTTSNHCPERIPRSAPRLMAWCAPFKKFSLKIPKFNAWFSPSGPRLCESWRTLCVRKTWNRSCQVPQNGDVAVRLWSP